MAGTDPRVVSSLREQLRAWRATLDAGAERVGWKIGLNVPEVQRRLGLEEPVIGHLTSATRIGSGEAYDASSAGELRVEPEVAVYLARDVEPDAGLEGARAAVGALGAALEVVDVGDPPADLEAIVAGNVFHRAFLLAAERPAQPTAGVTAEVRVQGETRASAALPEDFAAEVELVARLLGAVGERLEAGDAIIAGSLSPPVAVSAGDEVEVALGGMGSLRLRIAG